MMNNIILRQMFFNTDSSNFRMALLVFVVLCFISAAFARPSHLDRIGTFKSFNSCVLVNLLNKQKIAKGAEKKYF